MSIRLGFLGGGRMASAIADGLLASDLDVTLSVSDPALQGDWSGREAKVLSAQELFETCDWLVWAIKPQVFKEGREAWSSLNFGGRGMISVMAGIQSQALEQLFPGVCVVRTMPNTPMMFSEGMVAMCKGQHASQGDLTEVQSFFKPVAKTLFVEEEQMDGVTAISGSGPAYVFRLSEEVMARSAEIRLSEQEALTLWAQTLRGAAAMLEGGTAPATLREQVTSPGGTTQAALETFEKLGMASAFGSGLKAAYERSLELG